MHTSRNPDRRWVGLAIAALALLAAVVASIAIGARSVPLRTVAAALVDRDGAAADQIVVRRLRLPRTLVGAVAGTALGVAGTVMQGLTRNPLADPGLLGVNAGAAFGVVMGIHVLGVTSAFGSLWAAFVGAAVAAAVVHAVGAVGSARAAPARLVLAGAAVTALLVAATSAVLVRDEATLDRYRFWSVGSLAGRDLGFVLRVLPFVALGVALALAIARPLDALALGDDVAAGAGVRVGRARAIGGLAVVLLAGGATALAGPIGFVGLAVPHLVRPLAAGVHRRSLGYALLVAPSLVLAADVLGRTIARPGEVQVGVMTALLGAPLFLVLVRRRGPARR